MSLSIVILTGQSGSGKSTAVRALEDREFLCIDNLPPSLMPGLVEAIRGDSGVERLAVVIDARDPGLLKGAPAVIAKLRLSKEPVRVVYFEAREEILVRRYSETRRRHPLDHGEGLRASLAREHSILAPLRELADEFIDTSAASPHELRARVTAQLADARVGDELHLALVSFGFKHGLPLDADVVLDVRFLPNPYFVPELRARSGLHPAVRDFVLASTEGSTWLRRTAEYLTFLLPQFKSEGKRYLTVAIGCTGGQHRSVCLAAELAQRVASAGIPTDVRHRDVQEVVS